MLSRKLQKIYRLNFVKEVNFVHAHRKTPNSSEDGVREKKRAES